MPIKSEIKVYSSESKADVLLQYSIPKDGSAGDNFMSGSNETHARCIMRLDENAARGLALDILNHLAERKIRQTN